MSEPLSVAIDGHVATVTINRKTMAPDFFDSLEPTFGEQALQSAGNGDAFIANMELDCSYFNADNVWYAGQVIEPPTGTDVSSNAVTCIPKIFIDGQQVVDGAVRLFNWSYSQADSEGRLHALQPGGNVEIRWYLEGNGCDPTSEVYNIGFRVAQVPEPATLTLLTLGGLSLFRRWKRGACK